MNYLGVKGQNTFRLLSNEQAIMIITYKESNKANVANVNSW